VWLRADGRLPDDPILHTIVLTYASDMTLLDTATLPHGGSWFDPNRFMASLDHAMWFHRPFRADDWLLYAQDSPNASGGRGLSRGLVFTRDGTLVATVMQEGLIRSAR
jgi:acyl-CoA thioesterase-2